jgi:arginyl-tRNA synthetase
MISLFLKEEIKRALEELSIVEASFSVSKEGRFGDYNTNAAMVIASNAGRIPRDVAEEIVGELSESGELKKAVSKIEIAGPGFINFYLTDEALCAELESLPGKIAKGYDFLSGKKINVEFISANPTGELHIGHGRGAFYGDALSNILSFSGAKVTREYYINDSKDSNQIVELGKTALGQGEQYKTFKILEIIKEMDFSGMEPKAAGAKLAGKVQEYNRKFIEGKLGVKFDEWFSENTLYESGKVEKMVKVLDDKKLLHKKDGEGEALWLLTSKYGDDEDRVVVRSDGTYTYFLSDIAYHSDKFGRGYDKVIDIWGADHHGHVKRIQSAKEMLDWKGEFKVFITQLVSLKENGVSAKMSKRAGNVILLENLVDEFGLDVVRWFFSDKSLSTHMDFDMALAKEHSAKNPVFYVQYAHARICSILEKAKGVSPDGSSVADIMKESAVRALAVKIAEFPEIIFSIANDCQVHKLTTYAHELASSFAQFYEKVRIVGDDSYNEGALTLAESAKETLAKSLNLLGISAPEKM